MFGGAAASADARNRNGRIFSFARIGRGVASARAEREGGAALQVVVDEGLMI